MALTPLEQPHVPEDERKRRAAAQSARNELGGKGKLSVSPSLPLSRRSFWLSSPNQATPPHPSSLKLARSRHPSTSLPASSSFLGSPSMTSRINLPAWEPPPAPKRRWNYIRRPVIFFPLASLVLFTYLLLPTSSPTSPHFTIPLPDRLHNSLDDFFTSSSSSTPPTGEFHCNPFASNGRLHVDLSAPSSTLWTPFDTSCAPSAYLSSLYRPEDDTSALIPPHTTDAASTNGRVFLPWLLNRTVVIHGDSIDRFHLKDFCTLVQGRLFLVTPSHPASPPPYVKPHDIELDADGKESAESVEREEKRREKEAFWEGRPVDGQELTNPWVCDVEEYGATLVSVFTWGLEGAEQFFETERWYHGPGEFVRATGRGGS